MRRRGQLKVRDVKRFGQSEMKSSYSQAKARQSIDRDDDKAEGGCHAFNRVLRPPSKQSYSAHVQESRQMTPGEGIRQYLTPDLTNA